MARRRVVVVVAVVRRTQDRRQHAPGGGPAAGGGRRRGPARLDYAAQAASRASAEKRPRRLPAEREAAARPLVQLPLARQRQHLLESQLRVDVHRRRGAHDPADPRQKRPAADAAAARRDLAAQRRARALPQRDLHLRRHRHPGKVGQGYDRVFLLLQQSARGVHFHDVSAAVRDARLERRGSPAGLEGGPLLAELVGRLELVAELQAGLEALLAVDVVDRALLRVGEDLVVVLK